MFIFVLYFSIDYFVFWLTYALSWEVLCLVFLPWTEYITCLFSYIEEKDLFFLWAISLQALDVLFLWLVMYGNIQLHQANPKYIEMERGDHMDAQGRWSHLGIPLCVFVEPAVTSHLCIALP